MIYILSLITILLNICDSITTSLAFKQYPDTTLKGEANPIMRRIMLKSPILAQIIKHLGVLTLVIFMILIKDIFGIRLLLTALTLVVLNNIYLISIRAIRHYKVISPTKALQKLLHLPDKLVYPLVIIIIITLSWGVNILIGGV